MNKYIVYRMDLLSREKYPRERLLRLVKKGEEVVLDKEGTLPGRGFYLLKDEARIKETFQKKRLNRLVPPARQASLLEELLDAVRRGN